ncbi:MAG: hypothetical protein AAF329_10740 [Cyanobacteria bacterium P01_A01_bin.17]
MNRSRQERYTDFQTGYPVCDRKVSGIRTNLAVHVSSNEHHE